MEKQLPAISCQRCYTLQVWRGQASCTSCGERLNNWSVASQLQTKAHTMWEKGAEPFDEEDGA